MSKIRVEELETLDGLNLAKVEDLAKVGDPETGLDRRVIYVDTIADLQALGTSGLVERQQASVGEAGMFTWSGSEWLPKNNETITVRIPSDYPTLQEAIDTLSNFKPAQGVIIDLLIESGHEPEYGVFVENGSYNHFRISSEDSEVLLPESYSSSAFIQISNCFGPVLNCLVDSQGNCSRGYWSSASRFRVNQGCGVKGVVGEGIWAYYSSFHAQASVWSNTQGYAIRASRGTIFNAEFADVSNSINNIDNGVVYVNRGSIGHIGFMDLSGCEGEQIIYCHRGSILNANHITADSCIAGTDPFFGFASAARDSIINMSDAVVTNLSGNFLVSRGAGSAITFTSSTPVNSISGEGSGLSGSGRMSFNGTLDGFFDGVLCQGGDFSCSASTILNSGRNGIFCEDDGSVNARQVNIDNSTNVAVFAQRSGRVNVRDGAAKNSGTRDINLETGAIVNAVGCETTNGDGGPVSDDTQPTASLYNTVTPRGILWA